MVTIDLMTQMALLTNMTLMDAMDLMDAMASEAAMDLVSQLLVVDPRSSMSAEDWLLRKVISIKK